MHNAQFTIHNFIAFGSKTSGSQCIMHNYFSFIFCTLLRCSLSWQKTLQSYTFFFKVCIRKHKKMHTFNKNAHFLLKWSVLSKIYVTFGIAQNYFVIFAALGN